MTTMASGKWPRGRPHHQPSPMLYTLGRGQVRLVRGRVGVMRGRSRGSELYGHGGYGGYTSTPSTTIYTEAFRSIVSVG